MGLAASSGYDNDDLIDKLIDANIVTTHRVETALRLVDRRRFFPVEGRNIAYKDLAWKSDSGSPGRIHISAPCIYGNVLECLDLQEGNSFLNIGSGTGYLNTVAGYLLGSSGTNHGVEIHSNIIEYSRSLVIETLHCPETQCYDWAIPEFACGNGLHLSPHHYSRYDRVYCGASVPQSHRRILWELLKIGGILVMPYEDQLLQVRRQAPNVFEVKIITSVSFSNFIPPTEEEKSKELYSSAPPFRQIPTLQFLCALSIRKIIRGAVAANHKIHIRNYVDQQPQRTRENQVIVEFRDGEYPLAQRVHYENHQPPFREILAIVGADLVDDHGNEDNNEVEGAVVERRRRLARERFRMVWFRHHLRTHVANRAVRRRRSLETEAHERDDGAEDDQNSDVDIDNGDENSEYGGSGSLSATTSGPTDAPVDAAESHSDGTSATGRTKKRSLAENEGESSLSAKRRNDEDSGCIDKEIMETDLTSDCRAQNIPKQNLADNSKSDKESVVIAIAQGTPELEKSANPKNEGKNLKFIEGEVKNRKGSVSHSRRELVEQLQDSRKKETSISKHKKSIVRSSLQGEGTSSSYSNYDGERGQTDDGQDSSKTTNRPNQIQNLKMSNEVKSKKRVNFPPPEALYPKDNEIKWKNNKLYKNKTENEPTGTCDSSNEVGNSQSSDRSKVLQTTNSELQSNNPHLVVNTEEEENANNNDDEYDDGDSDRTDDNDDEGDDDDDDDDGSDDDDDDANDSVNSSNDLGDPENNPEGDGSNDPCARLSSGDENDLYLAIRHAAESLTVAVGGQASTENDDESESSGDDYHDAMDDESMYRPTRDTGDEMETEEEKKREEARLEERGRQFSDICAFAALFERRVMELPLNRALKEYIKCLC
ncbi:unnamed protein product [Litomosoides sigmodontis]|uniref:Protein-L-isoaspartate O-methyltransferase domain-containing protein n=1 Tax=Litomosoides sigmodontis TaxID=42156 RepID=A0A3P6SKZ1_LITSI|nr:unnamed protein product [Litomosoides sigmodontis]